MLEIREILKRFRDLCNFVPWSMIWNNLKQEGTKTRFSYTVIQPQNRHQFSVYSMESHVVCVRINLPFSHTQRNNNKTPEDRALMNPVVFIHRLVHFCVIFHLQICIRLIKLQHILSKEIFPRVTQVSFPKTNIRGLDLECPYLKCPDFQN